MEKRQSLQQVVLGKLDSCMEINEVRTLPQTIHKSSKWIKDFNIRHDTIQLPEENIGKTFSDLNRTNVFISQYPKAIEIKMKIKKWDLIKLISFCTTKETINKTKRQPMDWEKIFANDATDKGLISKIYKQLILFSNKKTTQSKNGQKT